MTDDILLNPNTPLPNANDMHAEKLSYQDRVALYITERVGSMGFFGTIFLWTAFWISWNMLAPATLRFDPYPAYVLWLFISNMIQIFLMPMIMIGQNLQSRHAEARAEASYQIAVKAEGEIQKIQSQLTELTEYVKSTKD